jgi:hypothetical protein
MSAIARAASKLEMVANVAATIFSKVEADEFDVRLMQDFVTQTVEIEKTLRLHDLPREAQAVSAMNQKIREWLDRWDSIQLLAPKEEPVYSPSDKTLPENSCSDSADN